MKLKTNDEDGDRKKCTFGSIATARRYRQYSVCVAFRCRVNVAASAASTRHHELYRSKNREASTAWEGFHLV